MAFTNRELKRRVRKHRGPIHFPVAAPHGPEPVQVSKAQSIRQLDRAGLDNPFCLHALDFETPRNGLYLVCRDSEDYADDCSELGLRTSRIGVFTASPYPPGRIGTRRPGMATRRLYEDAEGSLWLEEGGKVWDVTEAANGVMQLLCNGVSWTPAVPEAEADRLKGPGGPLSREGAVDSMIAYAVFNPDDGLPNEVSIFPDRAGGPGRRVLGVQVRDEIYRDGAEERSRLNTLTEVAGRNHAVLAGYMTGSGYGVDRIEIAFDGRAGSGRVLELATYPENADLDWSVEGLLQAVRAPDGVWMACPCSPPPDLAAAAKQLALDILQSHYPDWETGPGGGGTVSFESDIAEIELGRRVVHVEHVGTDITAERGLLAEQPEDAGPGF